MSLRFEFLALLGKLLDLEAVHQECDFQTMAVEHIHDAPDADAVAVLSFRDGSHVFLKHRIDRRDRVGAVALQGFARGEILRPNFPGNNKRNAYAGLFRPFDDSRSSHKALP